MLADLWFEYEHYRREAECPVGTLEYRSRCAEKAQATMQAILLIQQDTPAE